jgi:hypothetical protein
MVVGEAKPEGAVLMSRTPRQRLKEKVNTEGTDPGVPEP